MTQFSMQRSIDAPADVVWEVITDPDVYAAVAPNLSSVEILSGQRVDTIRRCVDTDGNAWTETCTRWEEGSTFAVAVDVETSDFHRRLFTWFEGEWSLSQRAEDVLVTASFDFDTKYGPFGKLLAKYFQYKAPSLVEQIFDGWEAEIEARLTEPETGGTAAPTEERQSN